MKRIFLLLPALACLALPVCGQTPKSAPAKPALPAGPLLHSAADFSQWEISFIYPDVPPKKTKVSRKEKTAPASLDARPQKIVTTKTGRIVHEVRTDALQRTSEVWFDGGTQYTKSGKDSLWYRTERLAPGGSATDVNYHPIPASGFRDVDLIKAENYAGTAAYDKRNCLVFVPGGADKLNLNGAGDAQKKLKALDIVAYVDADSRLPVAVRTRGELRVFQFDPPPTEMQTLPVDLTTQIKKGEDARTRLNQPAPKPY